MKQLGGRLDQLIAEMLHQGIRYDEASLEIERRFILRALDESGGNLGRAATMLGMHRNTLTRKLGVHRIARKAPKA